MKECEEMLKIVQRYKDSRLDLVIGSRGWLAACKSPKVAHVPNMLEVEALAS